MLRPYQIETVDKLRRACAEHAKAICVVMPTGAGKTRTFAEGVCAPAVAKGRRVLWLAHRGELVDQAVGALSDCGLVCGAVSASATAAPQPHAPVQVATVQTLLSRNLRPAANLIVADEAHHYVAETFGALIRDYPGVHVFGPTATPERSDGRGLGELFTRIVVGVRVRELTELGFLVPATLIAPARKLRVGEIAQRPVDAYREHACPGGPPVTGQPANGQPANGRRAIVFSPTVALAAEHVAQFIEAGIPAALVTGETPWSERRRAFADLRSGAVRVLCNVYVATEGVDVPELDCVILARGIGSDGGYLQMVGRALRPAPGKVDALILDLTGTSHVHGHPADDRQYSLEGRGIRKGDDSGVDQSYCRVCGAPIEPGAACAECGTEPRIAEQRITGDRLVKYESKRKEAPEQRAHTLARWIVDGAHKGYKPTWAHWKYKAVYGGWPPREIAEAARVILAGKSEAA